MKEEVKNRINLLSTKHAREIDWSGFPKDDVKHVHISRSILNL